MILQVNKDKIKYILCNEYLCYNYTHCDIDSNNLTNLVKLCDFGTRKDYYLQEGSYMAPYLIRWIDNNRIPTPGTSSGVYLGDLESINDKINSRYNIKDQEALKKVYFDPTSKYPRNKLSTLTPIKRCLNPEKADTAIISNNIPLRNYELTSLVSSGDIKDVLILYSVSENCYYFIDYIIDNIENPDKSSRFNTLCNKYRDPNLNGLYSWASVLINGSILPNDCKQVYYGRVILLSNLREVTFVENLLTRYSNIIYDSDLEKLVSNKQLKVTEDDIISLGNLISSNDPDNVNLGIKLLSSYNINEYPCSISIYLLYNWKTIKRLNSFNSKAFNYILSILGIEKKDVRGWTIDNIVTRLYSRSTNSKDKELSRSIIKDRITKHIYSIYNRSFSHKYPSMNFTAKLIIE